eukprot:NODE_1975_length_524_cov_300.490526_g1610_i0.p1 GENE.NODE_1975_length_524_cov_300.490526_g1610_i0~~NODE_1975_length_524_cov_300.490526_g1610_i0.p1  ORF type:complete len:166 (-),score=31.12 NODE_1975_length_524_cov_300.490526_g1610_i0:26-493(-)
MGLDEEFARLGRIKKITVPRDHHTGKNKGFAFLEYEDQRDAMRAMEKWQGRELDGRRLRIDWDPGLQAKQESGAVRKPRQPRWDSPRRRSRSTSRDRDPKRRRRSPTPPRRSRSPGWRSPPRRSPPRRSPPRRSPPRRSPRRSRSPRDRHRSRSS